MRPAGRAAVTLAVLLLVGACGTGGPTPSTAPSAATSAPTPAPTVQPAPTPTPTPLASGAAVTLDETLLAILPATADGALVTSEADSFAQAIKDPAFVANVDRAAFAVAVDGHDLASGVIAHLRPGVYSDALWSPDIPPS